MYYYEISITKISLKEINKTICIYNFNKPIL